MQYIFVLIAIRISEWALGIIAVPQGRTDMKWRCCTKGILLFIRFRVSDGKIRQLLLKCTIHYTKTTPHRMYMYYSFRMKSSAFQKKSWMQDVSTSISIAVMSLIWLVTELDESDKHIEGRDSRYSCLIKYTF